MKALQLVAPRTLALVEIPDPVIRSADEVKIRVGCVGVCGSDIHYYLTGRIGSQVVTYPFVLGHEFAGTVTEVGPEVRYVRPGDRVAVEPAMSCGRCDQCQGGRPHTCRHLRFLGCPGQAEGCLAEFVVMPEACCYPLPASLTLEHGALIEPLAIGLYAVRLFRRIRGARVAVLGCGPIGLSVLLAARAEGVAAAYATDKLPERLAAAARAGAAWTGNPDHEDVVASILSREPLQLDAVFECCGQPEALDQAVALLKPGGTLLLIGIPTAEQISFPIDRLRRYELVIQNVRRQNHCTAPARDLMAAGQVQADFLVTHRFPLEEASRAFELVAGYRDGVVKAMIHVDGGEGSALPREEGQRCGHLHG